MQFLRNRLVQWVLAAVLGGSLALGAAAWWQRAPTRPPAPVQHARRDPPPQDSAPRPDTAAADDTPASAPDTASAAERLAEPAAPASDATAPPGTGLPLRIRATPAELRVWANTRVRLEAEAQPGSEFTRYVWHFEDGSDPVDGAVVEHDFAESVRDRHITLEGHQPGVAHTVVSLRLPVERLEVVPVDGGPVADERLPAKAGPRLVFAGADVTADQAGEVVAAAARAQADALVVAGDAAAAAAVVETAGRLASDLAILHWPTSPDPAGQPTAPPLQVLRNPAEKLVSLQRDPGGSALWALGDLALVAVDTRADTVSEPELRRLREALQVAAAYRSSLLLSARPLTLLRDGELIADRAYRIYEYALRNLVGAVVSAASGVVCYGRFGALQAIAIGPVRPEVCARPTGTSMCQPGSLTVVDPAGHSKVATHVLVGPGFEKVMPRRELPSEVGKLRR